MSFLLRTWLLVDNTWLLLWPLRGFLARGRTGLLRGPRLFSLRPCLCAFDRLWLHFAGFCRFLYRTDRIFRTSLGPVFVCLLWPNRTNSARPDLRMLLGNWRLVHWMIRSRAFNKPWIRHTAHWWLRIATALLR